MGALAVVEAQVTAFNDGLLDAFLACYSSRVRMAFLDGSLELDGAVEFAEYYARRFANAAGEHCEIVQRIALGQWVVDHERLTGAEGARREVLVAFRIDGDGLIDRVVVLAS